MTVRFASAALGVAEDTERRAALVAHARLRRGENHGRVASSGGADRRARRGSETRRHFVDFLTDDPRVASLIAGVAEPAGARNTPLLAAAGFGRAAIVDMVLRARPETRGGVERRVASCGGIRRAESGGDAPSTRRRSSRETTRGARWGRGDARRRGTRARRRPGRLARRVAKSSDESSDVRAAMTSKDAIGRSRRGAAARRDTPTRSARFLDTPRPPWRRRRPSRRRRRDGDTSTRFARSWSARGTGSRPRRTRGRERRRRDGAEPTSCGPYANGTRRRVSGPAGVRTRYLRVRGFLPRPRLMPGVPWSGRGRCFAIRGRARGCFTRRGFGIRTRDTPRREQVAGITSRETIRSSPRGSKGRATPGSARPGVLRRGVLREGRRADTGREPDRIRTRTRGDFDFGRLRPRALFGGLRTGTTPITRDSPRRVSPPDIIRRLAAAARAACGQTCNHAVVNRYRTRRRHRRAADKNLDLEGGSYVVSVSFGAARTMTFRPRRTVAEGGVGPEAVKRASRALAAKLALDDEWRAAVADKRRRAESEEKRAAVERERRRAATLRETNDDVAAAAAAARGETRVDPRGKTPRSR